MTTLTDRSRTRAFAALVVCSALAAAVYVGWAAMRAGALPGTQAAAYTEQEAAALERTRDAAHVLFRSTQVGDGFGRLAAAALDAPDAARAPGERRCDRVYYAGGAGICLSAFEGALLGPDLQPTHTFALSGIPSRARVSPDGRYAATTVFVSGHSYAEGTFSTETLLFDVADGRVIANLEDFAASRDGQQVLAEDRNFWGVTFARDGRHFFATMATGGETYLMQGDIEARTLHALRTNVECPSLSPDNTRVAYKKLVQEGLSPVWRIHVLDLATGVDTPVAETRSVDDQVEWFDDRTLLYGLPAGGTRTDVWAVPADGGGAPAIFVPGGESPSVQR
jgi:hypothetical protein